MISIIVGNLALNQNIIKPLAMPSVEKMFFLTFSADGSYERASLQSPTGLLESKTFNPKWKTTFFVTGWRTNSNKIQENMALQIMLNAYKNQNVNFLVCALVGLLVKVSKVTANKCNETNLRYNNHSF